MRHVSFARIACFFSVAAVTLYHKLCANFRSAFDFWHFYIWRNIQYYGHVMNICSKCLTVVMKLSLPDVCQLIVISLPWVKPKVKYIVFTLSTASSNFSANTARSSDSQWRCGKCWLTLYFRVTRLWLLYCWSAEPAWIASAYRERPRCALPPRRDMTGLFVRCWVPERTQTAQTGAVERRPDWQLVVGTSG